MREIIKVILFIGIYSVTLNINKDNNFIKIDKDLYSFNKKDGIILSLLHIDISGNNHKLYNNHHLLYWPL
jgi:hypothetical protein